MSLRDQFYSQENADYLITTIISQIFKKRNIKIKYDEILHEYFSNFATKIYNESGGNGSLVHLNNQVIQTVCVFIVNNLNNFTMDEYIDTASREHEIFSREYGTHGHQEDQIITQRNRNERTGPKRDIVGETSGSTRFPKESDTRKGSVLEEYNRHPSQQNEYNNLPSIQDQFVIDQRIYPQTQTIPYFQGPMEPLTQQPKPTTSQNQNFKRNVSRTRSKPQNQNLDAIKILKNNLTKETPIQKSKEETIKINLDQFSKKVNLENVVEIEFLKLDIKNVDYIINESNNLLMIDSKPVIISPGNYTPEQLIQKLNEVCENVKFTICEYNRKVTISIEDAESIIEPEFSTLLDCLGGCCETTIIISKETPYTFAFPIKLLKKSVLDIVVYINESDIILDESVLFNHYCDPFVTTTPKTVSSPIEINTIKKFNGPVSIETIDTEFKNYNTRNYPFALFIKVKKLVA